MEEQEVPTTQAEAQDFERVNAEREALLTEKVTLTTQLQDAATEMATYRQLSTERLEELTADNTSLGETRDVLKGECETLRLAAENDAREIQGLRALADSSGIVRSVLAVDHPEEQILRAVCGLFTARGGPEGTVEADYPLPMVEVPVPGDPSAKAKRLEPAFAAAVEVAFQLDTAEVGPLDVSLKTAGALVAWLCGRLGGAFTRKMEADNPANSPRLLAIAEWFRGYHNTYADRIRAIAMGEEVDRPKLEEAVNYLYGCNEPRGREVMAAVGMPIPDLV